MTSHRDWIVAALGAPAAFARLAHGLALLFRAPAA